MSRIQFEKELQRELLRLNKRIDRCIIKGLPYAKEARRHRFLVSQLQGGPAKEVRRGLGVSAPERPRPVKVGWVRRATALISAFVL